MTDLYDDLDEWVDEPDDDAPCCHAPGHTGDPICTDDICRGLDACMYGGFDR